MTFEAAYFKAFQRKKSTFQKGLFCYRYVRGVPLKKDSSVHIPGCGDLQIKDVCFLPDPCPLPGTIKKRALIEKERLVYAPFSGVGGIVYDKDAVYIDLGGSHYHKDDTGLLSSLQNPEEMLDEKLEKSELKLFSDSAPIKSKDVDDNVFGITSENVVEDGRVRRKVIFKDNSESVGAMECLNDSDAEDIEEGEDDEEEDDDEDNESEDDDDEGDLGTKRKSAVKNSNSKRKKTEDSNDESSDDDLQEREPEVKIKRKKNEDTQVNQPSSGIKDTYIKDRITEALSLIGGSKSSKSKGKKISDDEESFDELSGDERENMSLDESDRESIYDDEKNQEGDENEDDNLRWKNNLAQKARDAFLNRRRENVNIEKIVYGVFDKSHVEEDENEDAEESEDNVVGGIFHVVKQQQQQKLKTRELKNQVDCPFFSTETSQDWLTLENKALLVNRFVTGKWKESEDAEELLKLDDLNEDDVYGDFEDLETGEKFQGKSADGGKLFIIFPVS